MMKQETKTNKEALLQAAGMLRKLSKVNYYDTNFTDMLGNIRKADRIVGSLEKKGAIPQSFAKRQPINGVPYEDGMKKVHELCKNGSSFSEISYALSIVERAVPLAAKKNADFITEVYLLKEVYLGVEKAINSAAAKLEGIADKSTANENGNGYEINIDLSKLSGFLGC